MANHTRSLVIEGFPVYFGEPLSWHEGEAISALVDNASKPQVSRSVDVFGGVMSWDNMTFEVLDYDDRIADLFRFSRTTYPIISPDPLYSESYGEMGAPQAVTLNSVVTSYSDLVSSGATGLTLPRGEVFAGMTTDWSVEGTVTIGSTTSTTYVIFDRWTAVNAIRISIVDGLLRCEVNNGSTTTTVNGSTTVSAYDHFAVVQSSASLVVYLNGIADGSSSSAVTPQWVSGLAPTLCYRSSGTSTLKITDLSVYARALSDTEVFNASIGYHISGDDLLYRMDLRRPATATLMDIGPYRLGCPLTAAGPTMSGRRDMQRGDTIYLPYDTAICTGPSSDPAIYVRRQAYSCLEGGWWAFYQSIPYPGATDGSDAVVTRFALDGPWFYSGRLIAYYIDGDLAYLGRIANVAHDGRTWSIETTDILQPFRDGFKPLLGGVRVADEWTIGPHEITFDLDGTLETTVNGITEGGYSYAGLTSTLVYAITSGGAGWSVESGYVRTYSIAGTTNITLTAGPRSNAAIMAFSEDQANPGQNVNDVYYAQRGLSPVPQYGICAASTIRVLDPRPELLIGSWLKINDILLYVYDADNTAGTISVEGYDKDFVPLLYNDAFAGPVQAWGLSQDYPITLQGTLIVTGTTPLGLMQRILTSTGTGNNGPYDDMPGWVGLGLPQSIVDLQAYSPFISPVTINLADGKLSDDLQALGYCLLFEDGKFAVKKVDPPVIALAETVITDEMRSTGGPPRVSWGYFAPVSSISYTTKTGTMTAVAWVHSVSQADARKAKDLTSACGVRLTDAQRQTWFETTYKRLQWLTNYAPTVEIQLPETDLQLLDVVALQITGIAGQGRYEVSNIPGIVVKVASDWRYQICLNTSDTASLAAWVPSWEIVSYSSTSATVSTGAEDELSRWSLPLTCQIIDHAGAVLTASVNITAASSNLLTLSAAPTYTQTQVIGIITLPDYTTALTDDQVAFVWAANTSGVMSDSDPGKDLK